MKVKGRWFIKEGDVVSLISHEFELSEEDLIDAFDSDDEEWIEENKALLIRYCVKLQFYEKVSVCWEVDEVTTCCELPEY